MPFFKKKKKEEVIFPEFPELPKEQPLKFPPYSPKDFPSLKEIKQAVTKQIEEPKSGSSLAAIPKLTETITYEPREQRQSEERPLEFRLPEKKPLELKPLPSLPSLPSFPETLRPLTRESPFDIPVRKRLPVPREQPMPAIHAVRPRPMQQQSFKMPMERQLQPRYQMPAGGKPLFVQIDEYNKIIETVNNLKFSLQEAERILASLKQLKERENDELGKWEDHLSRVKDKLLMIDKRLFENA